MVKKTSQKVAIEQFKVLEVLPGEVAWVPNGMIAIPIWENIDLDLKVKEDDAADIAFVVVHNVLVKDWVKDLDQEVSDKMFQEMVPFMAKHKSTDAFGPSISYVQAFHNAYVETT